MTFFGKPAESAAPEPAPLAPQQGVQEGTMLQRLRGMALIGWAIDVLSTRSTEKRIADETAAMAAKHGDHAGTTQRMTAYAAELEEKAKKL